MDALLANPAFQSAAAPFIVALVVGLALERVRLSGLAVLAGTLVCVYLALGLDFTPLTATRRIVILALAGALVGAALDLALRARTVKHWPFALIGAVAFAWTAYAALKHRDLASAAGHGLGLGLASACVVWAFDRLHAQPIRAGAASLATGLSVGAAAILSASASLGQIGLALGAAAGAILVVAMARGRPLPAGRALTLPAGLLGALLACAAVILAKLPWFIVPLLAAVPIAAGLPLFKGHRPLTQSVLVSTMALAPGLLAVALTWFIGGAGESAASGY